MGCDGCNSLDGIDHYALKCTEITLIARINVLVYIHPGVCKCMGYSPLAPINMLLKYVV